jgi:hypothetical protein
MYIYIEHRCVMVGDMERKHLDESLYLAWTSEIMDTLNSQ